MPNVSHSSIPVQTFIMCLFRYHVFEQCSHGVINIAEYCHLQKWVAGIERQLRPCLGTTYRTSRHIDRGAQWQVISGTCFSCILQCRETAQLVASASKGGSTEKCIPMRPREPKQDHRKDSLSPIPPERPFLSLPGLSASLPELLGFHDKIYDNTAALFDKIVFPPRIMPYIDQTSSSWTRNALGVPHPLIYTSFRTEVYLRTTENPLQPKKFGRMIDRFGIQLFADLCTEGVLTCT
ncbi:hypothetical protein BKA64DRAFT_182873 [Cadophora sp. MPI-SDFR-AT-0126]|nr:hypothetical protein BKA64DRAFT_182873 [Leotiomycetes sp. MPI-SDFR-AT-0126]